MSHSRERVERWRQQRNTPSLVARGALIDASACDGRRTSSPSTQPGWSPSPVPRPCARTDTGCQSVMRSCPQRASRSVELSVPQSMYRSREPRTLHYTTLHYSVLDSTCYSRTRVVAVSTQAV